MTLHDILWIIPYIGELVYTYKYGLLVYKPRHPGIITVLPPVLLPSLIRLQPIQLRLLKSYTLISLKLLQSPISFPLSYTLMLPFSYCY